MKDAIAVGSGPSDLGEHLELELLLALAGSEHPPAAPEERIGSYVQLDGEADRAQQLQRPLAPGVPPRVNLLGRPDADDLALVEHLKARGVPGRLVPEDIRAAGIHRDPAGRERPARRDRRVHRVAGGRGEHEVGHRLESAPVLVAAGEVVLLGGFGLGPLEGEDAPGEVREGFEVADRLQVAPGKERREAHLLRRLGGGGSRYEVRDADAHVLEVSAAPIHAGHARLDQQSPLHQLGEKRRLLRAARAKAGH